MYVVTLAPAAVVSRSLDTMSVSPNAPVIVFSVRPPAAPAAPAAASSLAAARSRRISRVRARARRARSADCSLVAAAFCARWSSRS